MENVGHDASVENEILSDKTIDLSVGSWKNFESFLEENS
jgi:hypothetical protein